MVVTTTTGTTGTTGLTLAGVPSGSEVILATPDLDPPRTRRLAELGLRAGRRVRVLHRTAGGGRVLAVDGARIAVDRRTLRRLPVAPGTGTGTRTP